MFIYFSVANLLGNFSIAFTYETFIIIGLVIAVPLSSSKYNTYKYMIAIIAIQI